MNLHSLVSSVISAINPNSKITIQTSDGYTINPDGTPVPRFAPAYDAWAQVQELTTRDLRQLEALNVQGSMRTLYISGELDAIIRVSQKGGDLITLGDGSVWLTTSVLEQFYEGTTPNWVKVAITLQTDAVPVPVP